VTFPVVTWPIDAPATTISLHEDTVAKFGQVTTDFRLLLLTSFAIAAICFGFPFLAIPNQDAAVRFSLLLALVWIALVIFAFVRYGLRAVWCVFGLPLAGYWFVMLYSIAAACAQNLNNCP